VRWVDLNTEPGFVPEVRVPALEGTVTMTTRDGARLVQRESNLSGEVAALEAPSARGGDAVLAGFFAEPYGPKRLARFLDDKSHTEPPVYGLTHAQEQRMTLELSVFADTFRRSREMGGWVSLLGGGALTLAGGAAATVAVLQPRPNDQTPIVAGVTLVSGVALMGAAALAFGIESAPEKVLDTWNAPGADAPEARVGRALNSVRELARAERRAQATGAWSGIVLGTLTTVMGGALLALDANTKSPNALELDLGSTLAGGAIVGMGIAALSAPPKTPAQVVLELLEGDPDAPAPTAATSSVTTTTP
jgi:hypothetical protein